MKKMLLAGLLYAASLGTTAWWQARSTPASTEVGPPGFHHLHLNVADPSAEIAFYTMGFPTTSRADVFGLPALKTGHVNVLFTKVSLPPTDQPQSAYWHFGWHVLSARAVWNR